MVIPPRLTVIRGGMREDRAPTQSPLPHTRSELNERETPHSADEPVISIMEGWVRLLERQAQAIKP